VINMIEIQEMERNLNFFKPHQLDDLKKASLMNRVDTKFIVPINMLTYIFETIKNQYTILEIDSKRVFEYQNVYFDTPDFIFYRHHHNGKLNRFKVRCRNYVDSDLSFLEVKFKDNKKRTHKNRIRVDSHSNELIFNSDIFLNKFGIKTPQDLIEVQKGGYHRIALADEENAERLTIDLNLYFKNSTSQTTRRIKDHAIFELKQAKLNRNSIFFKVMQELSIKPSSFSKYCIGMAVMDEDKKIKVNNFKQIMRKVAFNTEEKQNIEQAESAA